jgi:hypothetical protein
MGQSKLLFYRPSTWGYFEGFCFVLFLSSALLAFEEPEIYKTYCSNITLFV